MFLRFDRPNPSNIPAPGRLYSVRALTVYGKTVEAMQLDKYKRFFRSSRPREHNTVSVTAQCKVFIVVSFFYNATALMLIPLLTLFSLVACWFISFFGGSFFGSVGFVWRFIRRCLIEDYFTIVCLMAVIRCVRVWRASGYRHHSRNRTQIPTRANKTKCDNKRGRGTRWAAMSLSHSLSGALHGVWEEQEHGTTEMLSYLCHAALWCGSGSCSMCVCVCVCVCVCAG